MNKGNGKYLLIFWPSFLAKVGELSSLQIGYKINYSWKNVSKFVDSQEWE